jgi:PAS domain S-box-containing protein
MNESIHGERTASEPQDRSLSVAHSIEVPSEIIRKWQEIVDLLAEIMHVPSASIMRVDPPHIKVFVSSTSKGNPCEPGALDTGPYCETVMKTGQPLLVPDALENEAWKANPHVKLGMISYLGVPIGWPDGRLFGTICVRDNKRNEYSEAYLKLLLHFRDMLQADLKSFARLHGEIEEREAKIRRLVDANIIGIIIWDLEGRILEANDAFLRMGGYDREDLISGRLNRTDLTPPEWREHDARTDAELTMIGAVQPFEKEYFRKDGGRVPVLIGLAAFGEERDQGVAFVLDLTERKCAEEALMRSEAYLAEAQKLTHTGSWAWDPRTEKVLYCSEEMFRIFGLDPRESLPSRDNFRQQIHPEDRDWVKKRFEEALRERVDTFAEYRVLLPDGTVRHINASGHPVLNEDGELIEFVGTAVDVTERKRAEEALRGSEAKFRDYAESASDWYWETDPDHKFTRVTDYERRLSHGFAPVSRIGLARWEFAMDVESEPEKWELHRSMLEARQPFRDFVYRAARSDGSLVYYKISGKPVFDANGEFRGYRGTGTDVTALRTAEAEARENERRYRRAELELAHANRVAAMGQLTASIAHEVNQPITAAVTNAQAALRWMSAEPPDFGEVSEALAGVIKEGNRASEVIGRTRALIKKAPPRKDAFSINDTILEVVALTRNEAANNGVLVRTQLAEGLPPVRGDRVQLQQVMLNLIVNAIQSMSGVEDGNRELHVSTVSIEPEGVCVAVRDTGHGLRPESLPRLFEPFYTTKPDGMGMGLSICRSIIEAQDGRLWATRCEPRGALFQFTIPATRADGS